MVTKEQKIQFKIDRLKNIQDNLKFGLSSRLILYLALIIFLLTLIMTMINYYEVFVLKLAAFGFGVLMYLVLTFYFYNSEIKPREKKLKDIAREIEKYYDQLLS